MTGQLYWKPIEVVVPATLSRIEVLARIREQIRVAAGDSGEFVQNIRIDNFEASVKGCLKWNAAYLPGSPVAGHFLETHALQAGQD